MTKETTTTTGGGMTTSSCSSSNSGGGGGGHYAFQSLLDGVQWSLDNSLFTNAVFLAERLNAAHPSDDSIRTLANCFHRQGRYLST